MYEHANSLYKGADRQTDRSLRKLSNKNTDVIQPVNGEMEVHFIDVGQADATLFIQDEYTMLFDVGTKNSSDEIEQYLKNLGINYIDILVLSHPHDGSC